MGARLAVVLFSVLLLAAADGRANPDLWRRDTAAFARQAHRLHLGSTRRQVHRLLGDPDDDHGEIWSYRNPPTRPDGPYSTFRFTFIAGKVSDIEEGGVACVYRQFAD